MGGVSGPGGAREEPRKNQRVRVQRGKTVKTVSVHVSPILKTVYFLMLFLPLAGHHAITKEGDLEVPPGLLPMEQHL